MNENIVARKFPTQNLRTKLMRITLSESLHRIESVTKCVHAWYMYLCVSFCQCDEGCYAIIVKFFINEMSAS